MRNRLLALTLLIVAACDATTPHAVDITTLPPLSGREMVLMTTAQTAAASGSPSIEIASQADMIRPAAQPPSR